MKQVLELKDIMSVFSFRVSESGKRDIMAIDALNIVPFSAVVANRVKIIKRSLAPIIESYSETANKKEKELKDALLTVSEKHDTAIKDGGDEKILLEMLQEDVTRINKDHNDGMLELQKETYELDFTPIKMSDFKIDPKNKSDDASNWHAFKGEYLDLLECVIVDDLE